MTVRDKIFKDIVLEFKDIVFEDIVFQFKFVSLTTLRDKIFTDTVFKQDIVCTFKDIAFCI